MYPPHPNAPLFRNLPKTFEPLHTKPLLEALPTDGERDEVIPRRRERATTKSSATTAASSAAATATTEHSKTLADFTCSSTAASKSWCSARTKKNCEAFSASREFCKRIGRTSSTAAATGPTTADRLSAFARAGVPATWNCCTTSGASSSTSAAATSAAATTRKGRDVTGEEGVLHAVERRLRNRAGAADGIEDGGDATGQVRAIAELRRA